MNPLPHSPDAERAVLGSVLLSQNAWHRLPPDLLADCFFDESNRAVFAALATLAAENRVIDTLTIKVEMEREGTLLRAGGAGYVASLTDMVPDIANVERYAAIVIELARKRALFALGHAMMQAVTEGVGTADDVAGVALGRLSGLATREESQARELSVILDEACAAQERRARGEQDAIALKSGMRGLDGVRALKRAFVVLGSPSEHGKTAAMVCFADALAMYGQPGAVFTLEDGTEEWALRFGTQKAGINNGIMQDWRLMNERSHARVNEARAIAAGRGDPPMAKVFLTRSIRTVEGIAMELQRLRAQAQIDWAMIDYLQLVRISRNAPRDREERFAEICLRLGELTQELGIMILGASQVNIDDWKKRTSGRLIKEDLKYARSIAEQARVVMLFHRPRAMDKTNEQYPWCEVKFQVEKNSGNRTTDVPFHFNEETQQFREGDCAANDCVRLRNQEPVTKSLFNSN